MTSIAPMRGIAMPEDVPPPSTPQPTPSEGQEKNNNHNLASLADALKQESERLSVLADQLREREKYLAEMEANYPYFKKAVYAWLIEKSLAEVPPLPDDVDLETWAKEQGGVPLEDFINDL
jgi:hypothetical protein